MRASRSVTKLTTFLLFLGLSCATAAQDKFGEKCTSEFPTPPKKIETGLGGGVDDLAHSAYPLQWRVKQVDAENWNIVYGDASFTDKKQQLISVARGLAVPYTTSHFAHEVGHATSGFGENISSREAYIKSRCTDEGYALGVNINARKLIKQCAATDIGVVSAEVPFFTEWYESMVARPPVLYGDFGRAFCEKNIESVSGKNYLDYYGDWYDSHMTAPGVQASLADGSLFFARVSDLASRVEGGVAAIKDVWPDGYRLKATNQARPRSYRGGPAPLVGAIRVVESELRVKRADPSRLVLATMNIDGPCVSLEMVRTQYPSAIMTDSPTTALPYDEGTWSAFGPWGEIGFGFAYANPKCVSSVTFKPEAFPPAWVSSEM
jgi:hypothetical protein